MIAGAHAMLHGIHVRLDIFYRNFTRIKKAVVEMISFPFVLATVQKLLTLGGRPLLVDTGRPETDQMLAGYLPVVTGLDEKMILKVEG